MIEVWGLGWVGGQARATKWQKQLAPTTMANWTLNMGMSGATYAKRATTSSSTTSRFKRASSWDLLAIGKQCHK
jgi:hypothetical protein